MRGQNPICILRSAICNRPVPPGGTSPHRARVFSATPAVFASPLLLATFRLRVFALFHPFCVFSVLGGKPSKLPDFSLFSDIFPAPAQPRTKTEPKSNHLPNQHFPAAQKRRKSGSKTNQNRIKSRKTFANSC